VRVLPDGRVRRITTARTPRTDVTGTGKQFSSIHTEHDFIRGFTVHFRWLQIAVEQLDVSTAAVDVLFVFDGVLYDQVFAVVAERRELLGQRVEPGVLRRLDTFVGLGVVVERARAVDELAELLAGVFRVRPFVFPRTCGGGGKETQKYQ